MGTAGNPYTAGGEAPGTATEATFCAQAARLPAMPYLRCTVSITHQEATRGMHED